jgi:ATP-dependent DNA ligase
MLQRPLPAGFIAPCLPTKTDKLPSGRQWLHEIKHTTASASLLVKPGAQVRLYSRPGNDLTRRFPLIVDAIARLRSRSCIIDGEAVACDGNGLAVFERLRLKPSGKHVFLYAFDLLELDGQDLRREPLETRKATLRSMLAKAGLGLRFNEHRPCLQDGARRYRVEAEGLGLPLRSVEGLAQVQESAAPAVKREAEEDWRKYSRLEKKE